MTLLAPPEPSAAAVPLAPGFRFHPTDEELVSYYLRRRVLGRRLRIDAIAEVDLYRLEPWDLPSLSRIRSRDAQWYFFAHLDRKIAGAGAGGRGGPGNRTNRATPRGYWKTTGKDREVYHRSKLVGMKKTLVFHSGRAPKGQRTNWVMHEYRLLDADGVQDLHVVCRIFQKFGSGPQNGAQYGAPYVEEEWEEDDDDPIENTPASGATTEMALVTDTAEEELDEADENVSSNANELAQVQEVLSQPELAPLQGEASNGTGDGSYGEGCISLEEILQEPVSNIRAESFVKPEEQSGFDDKFSITDLCGYPAQDDGYAGQDGPMRYPTQDDGYAGQDGPMRWNDPSNDDYKHWPLKTYSNQNNACGALTAEEFFDTGNGTNAYSGSQDMYLQRNGSSSSQQVDDNMVFYDAPSNHWVNGKDDCAHVNDLYQPVGNEFLFDAGDDLMAYFDATEDDIKFDILGSVEGSDSQIPDMSNFAQKGDDINGFADDVIFESSDANALYGASSSGSRDNLHPYPGTSAPDAPMDDSVDKSFGKHLASMLGSIPAPPAMASEFPPALGKSVGALSAVSPHSSFRVTAGIIQLGGLTFTGSSEHWPLQKNGDFSLLLSFTVEEDASTKSIGYEPAEPAQRMSPIPVVLRSGFYLFFVSAMILMLSYKVGLCIYSR